MTATLALSLSLLFTLTPAGQDSLTASKHADFVLTKEIKTETLNTLIAEMNETYVLPDVATKIENGLKQWMASSEFESTTDPRVFAKLVNDLMRKEVTDAHLRFRFSDEVLPKRENRREASPDELKRYREETKYVNSGFMKVERLMGNVGYVSFEGFWSPEDMERPLEGAMTFLANVDAFIVDLRDNGGGDPMGVRLFCSYFFDSKPVHLNDIVYREGKKTTVKESWTLKKVDGPRFPNVPLYVLTSKRTGSGAEECAYNFQQLKRGTIVGSSTWGGANPGGRVRLSDHFDCFIPVGMARNPYSKTNWEGLGVQPDVTVDPKSALKEAHKMSVQKLIDSTKDVERRERLLQVLDEVVKGQ